MKKTSVIRKSVFQLATIILMVCAPSLSRSAGLVAAWGDGSDGLNVIPGDLTDAKSVACGWHHNLALRADGSVVAWGGNTQGQTKIPGPFLARAIAAGGYHNLALKLDGGVVAWGSNVYGQTNIPVSVTNVTMISAGHAHSLALKADGTVVAWGDNSSAQTNVPVGLSNVTAIAAGGYHSLALKGDGTVVEWGYLSQASVPDGLSNVTAIAAGYYHSLALKTDGTIVGWGQNGYGQAVSPEGLSSVTAIAAGLTHSVALRADGTVLGWGYNPHGPTNVPPGLFKVTAVAAGYFHNLALAYDGPIRILTHPQSQEVRNSSNLTFSVVATGFGTPGYQWIYNGQPINPDARVTGTTNAVLNIANAQNADAGNYAVIVSNAFGSVVSSIATLTVISSPYIISQSANRVAGAGADVTFSVSAGGTPPLSYQWSFAGTNLPGKTSNVLNLANVQPLGSGVYTARVTNLTGSAQANIVLTVTNSAPFITQQPFVRLSNQSTTTNPVVPIGSSVTFDVSARGSTPLNYQWRFEGSDIPGATSPTLNLSNLRYDQTGYYTVEIRNAFGTTNSMKLLLNVVQVYVWGNSPVASDAFTPTNVPPHLTNVIAVAAGNYHLMVLKSDGRVATWASYQFAYAWTNVPLSVTNVTAIAAAGDNSMALRGNGTLVVWGNNSYGQTNIPTGVSNVMAIATGGAHCLALRTNGTIVGWGNNSYGQATSPVGLSNVLAIAAGGAHSLALQSDGTVVGWGYNAYGQVSPPAGLSNVIAIDAAGAISLALKADGTAVTWGDPYGRVPSNVTNLVATGVGYQRHVGLKADSNIESWVNNQNPPSPALSNVIAVTSGERGNFSAAVIGSGSPFFTIHPVSQSAVRSNTVKLHARAAGVQPMRFQWQLDGVNLAGATNGSLIIANVQGKDVGSYRCVAGNVRGTNTSASAQLTIPYSGTLATALNATNLTWTTNLQGQGFGPSWFAQIREAHDGDAAAQSGAIAHGQQSVLQTTVTGPGTLSFWWKVSSEPGYDFLRFYLDNLNTPYTYITGEADWQQVTLPIAAGIHTLRWVYTKDLSVNAGRDAGWLDKVTFLPELPTIIRHPVGQTVPMGANVTIPAVASSPVPMTYQWLKNGTNYPGATAQYLTLTNVNRRDSAIYTLRVSNAGGTVMSSNAALRVLVRQRVEFIQRDADRYVELLSRDADGGSLLPHDLPAFEAQSSTNLVDWEMLPGEISLTNGSLRVWDITTTGLPQRFYRIVEH